MRRIFIKGLNLITSTSPRFKKFLSPLISINFGRNFTECRIKCIWFISQKNWINGEEAKSTRIMLVLNSWISQLVCFHNYIKRRKVFNGLKSTSRKYKFKKIKQRLVLFEVVDYIAKKSSHLTGPFSYSYIKSKAMSRCQNKRSILKRNGDFENFLVENQHFF